MTSKSIIFFLCNVKAKMAHGRFEKHNTELEVVKEEAEIDLASFDKTSGSYFKHLRALVELVSVSQGLVPGTGSNVNSWKDLFQMAEGLLFEHYNNLDLRCLLRSGSIH